MSEIEPTQGVMPVGGMADKGSSPLALAGRHNEALEIVEFLESAVAQARPARSGIVRPAAGAVLGFLGWLIRSLFGTACLILVLAVVAAIPVVNLLALGYLLEVEGRLARSGKLRDAFPLIDLAPQLGSIVIGMWAFIFPLYLLAQAAAEAHLIDAGSRADTGLHVLVRLLAVVVTVHVCLALARGGSFSCFLRPIKNVRWLIQRLRDDDYWDKASAAVRDFVAGWRLKHHFLLGLKGYLGAMAWLVFPTALFAATNKTEGGPIIVTLIGGALLVLVLTWVPFLQAHFAAQNRFGAMFELQKVCHIYRSAPFAWTVTMVITFTLALPMYLFKIALPPSDAMWMVTIVFIISIYPVKVITGWAYHRAATREKRASFALRWFTRLLLLPMLTLYVFLLFFTQFIGEHGKRVLFEHHAFLLPAPF